MPNNLRLLDLIVFVCFSLLAMELYYHFDLQGGLLMLFLVVLDWVLIARAAEPTSEGDSANKIRSHYCMSVLHKDLLKCLLWLCFNMTVFVDIFFFQLNIKGCPHFLTDESPLLRDFSCRIVMLTGCWFF